MKNAVLIRLAFWVVLVILGWYVPSPVHAMEFAIVGPRAAGMGGAGVAVTTDSLATYWNPAGLAMSQTVDIRVQGTLQGIDRLGRFISTVRNGSGQRNRLRPRSPIANSQPAYALRKLCERAATVGYQVMR